MPVMTMTTLRAKAFDPQVLAQAADWFAVGVAVSLPWSTSAASILIALWLVTVLPTLNVAAVRRELVSAAGGLPVLLWFLGAVGMLWAGSDVTWSERFGGFDSFHRLLFIPLLLAAFRRSENGARVLNGFLVSVAAVLLLSWLLVLFPSLPWRPHPYGVPVKDYILQSADFMMCAFALFGLAFAYGAARQWRSVAWRVALAVLFLVNVFFAVTGRTTLLVAPVLLLLLGWQQRRWQGVLCAAVIGCIVGAAVWAWSPALRTRLDTSVTELHAYEASDALNSTALHLEFLKKSVSFVKAAPIIGHGTGSIPEQFRKAAVGETGAASVAALNPHNQTLAVAIQLGLVGAAVLAAMWLAHLLLFRGGGMTAWIGTIVVVTNVVSSLFNSHLFDFTQGWIYVFGVGVTGGMALRERDSAQSAAKS
jgi:O-antigen ligase